MADGAVNHVGSSSDWLMGLCVLPEVGLGGVSMGGCLNSLGLFSRWRHGGWGLVALKPFCLLEQEPQVASPNYHVQEAKELKNKNNNKCKTVILSFIKSNHAYFLFELSCW